MEMKTRTKANLINNYEHTMKNVLIIIERIKTHFYFCSLFALTEIKQRKRDTTTRESIPVSERYNKHGGMFHSFCAHYE
jgi:hypothetical protein